MSFVQNFSSSQNSGDITIATITDTSTGTDNTLTGKLIYFQKYDGTYLVPEGTTTDYVYWPIGNSSIDVDILDKDYCLLITVKWFSGSTVAYTKTILTLFTGYGDLFLRQLTQAMGATPDLIQNKNFWYNKNKLRVLLDDAAQAVSLLNDQTIATYCLNAAKQLTDNPTSFW